jgi:hypothetical protein
MSESLNRNWFWLLDQTREEVFIYIDQCTSVLVKPTQYFTTTKLYEMKTKREEDVLIRGTMQKTRRRECSRNPGGTPAAGWLC